MNAFMHAENPYIKPFFKKSLQFGFPSEPWMACLKYSERGSI